MESFTVKGKRISKCLECPFWAFDGFPSPTMECDHGYWKGQAYNRMIVRHPVCDTGFPLECPLRLNPIRRWFVTFWRQTICRGS